MDEFVANSENVRQQNPENLPAGSERGASSGGLSRRSGWEPAEDYYLIVSELVPYKRIDIAVRRFQKSGRKLRIAGDGPEFARLRNGAPDEYRILRTRVRRGASRSCMRAAGRS